MTSTYVTSRHSASRPSRDQFGEVGRPYLTDPAGSSPCCAGGCLAGARTPCCTVPAAPPPYAAPCQHTTSTQTRLLSVRLVFNALPPRSRSTRGSVKFRTHACRFLQGDIILSQPRDTFAHGTHICWPNSSLMLHVIPCSRGWGGSHPITGTMRLKTTEMAPAASIWTLWCRKERQHALLAPGNR